jgi:drug/metabolite transporter (DMT)-like permease
MMAALIASGLYAITVIIFKSQVHNYSRYEIIFYQNLFGSIIFLPFFIISIPSITSSDMILSSTYAIFIGMGVFYLFFYGLKYLKAYIASAVMYLEVVGAVTLGYIFLDERLTIPMIIGGTFIIISSFLLNQRPAS